MKWLVFFKYLKNFAKFGFIHQTKFYQSRKLFKFFVLSHINYILFYQAGDNFIKIALIEGHRITKNFKQGDIH